MLTTNLLIDTQESRAHNNDIPPCVLTIGNFDGFHLGHQKILKKVVKIASQLKIPSYVVTFEPNTKLFFKNEFEFIHTTAQKMNVLENCGVDAVLVVDFEKSHTLSGEDFVKSIFIEHLNAKHLVVGEGFKLGKERNYSVQALEEDLSQHGVQCYIETPVYWRDMPISSTRIRGALRNNEVESAAKMLGRPYQLDGIVVKGDGIGRGIGFPTINIKTENTILPAGVFISITDIAKKTKQYWGLTNIGKRPTLNGIKNTVETHLLDFNENVYDQAVVVHLIKKIRQEVRFDTCQQLSEQICQDVDCLREYIKMVT